MEEKDFQAILEEVLGRTQESANVRAVFGEPVKFEDKIIIPLATISASGGAGGGGGKNISAHGNKAKDKTPGGWGGGAGWHVESRPVGYLEITGKQVRFTATPDATKIALRIFTAAAIAAALFGLAAVIHQLKKK